MIRLEEVRKTFNGCAVLDGVSVSVNKGETFVVIGLSGSGKTVTLRHIAGLVDPDGGEVRIGGERMSGASREVKERLRKKMGVVFQSGALINWLTVRENIALPLVERRHPAGEIDDLVMDKLRLLGMADAGGKMPGELSGGMKKRVCLARVLVRNPEIILYDEPTSGLDPVMSTVINDLIRRMQGEFGVTSVVVTHDMSSAYHIADRIALLYEGRIIQCAEPDAIRDSEDPVVRQFINGSLAGPIRVD